MIKYYKYSIFKKTNDELWGYLINNYNFIKLKHKFLLKLQFFLKKNYFYKKKKWLRFKRFKFFRRVRRFNFAFVFYQKKRLWWIRRKIRHLVKTRRERRFKNFKFIKFLYNILNLNSFITFCYKNNQIFKFNKNKIIINKIKIKKYKNIFFKKKKLKIYNYIMKILKKRNFYKIKSKLKKALKSDLKFENQFFYSVHIIKPKPKIKRKRFEYKIKPFKFISLFYGFKKLRKFKLFFKKKHIKKYLKNFNNFLFLLESRLETFLFRINFFNSIYFIKQFIYNKNIYVNNIMIFRPDYQIKLFDIVNINYKYFIWLFKNIKYKLKHKFILLNIPNYIYMDWGLLIALFYKYPNIKQLNRPYKWLKYSFF